MKLTKTFAVIVALMMSLCLVATSAFAGSGADGGGGVSAGAVSLATQSKTPSVEYEKSADGKTFYIECINVDEYPVTIVLALYNGTKLEEVKISQGYSSEATFVTGCQYDKERIMVLKSLGTMCPVVKSENIIEKKVDDFSDAVYVNIADIDSTEEGETYDTILYYASPTTSRVSRYKLSKDAKYIYNNVQIDGFASFDEIIKDGYRDIRVHDEVEIALVDKDGDERIDLVGVKEYTYDIVNSVDKESSLVEGIYKDLKIEYENAAVSMKNAEGDKITLDDFSKGDVIAYISSNSDSYGYDRIEIINLGQNSVTGMVDETDAGNRLAWVNSTEYGVTGIEMPCLGDEGVFYLTKTGKIFFYELIIEKDYAYVLDAGFISANFTEVWQIKLLTQENEVCVYTVRDSIKFNGEYISCKRENCEYLETFIAKDTSGGKDADKGGHRVITYELDGSGRVKIINTVDSASFADEKYDEETHSLGTSLLDNTVLFNVSSDYREDYFASDISSLEDGTEYSGYHITYMSGIVDCVVITHPGLPEENVPEEEPEEVTSYYAYVVDAAINESSIDGLWQVKLLTEDDRVKVYTVKERVKINGETMYSPDECFDFFESFSIQHGTGGVENLDRGAHRVINYTLDANGEIRKIDTFGWTQFSDEQINASDFDENVIVFNVSSEDSDSWYATEISSFEGGELYSGYYITNLNDDNDCVVITEGLEKDIVEEPEVLTDMSYAYVLNSAFSDADFTECWQLKLLTQDNEIVIYTVDSSIKADDEIVSARTEDCEFLEDFVAWEDEYGNDLDKGAHRVVTYGVDSKNKIREINTVNYRYFMDKEYYTDTQVLGDAELADNAVIFNIAALKSDSYFATDISSLVEWGEYTGAYITNADGENDCIIITDAGSSINYPQDIAVVSSVSDSDIYGSQEDAKKVSYYLSSDKVCEYKIDTGSLVNYDNYESPSSKFFPIVSDSIVSDYEIINITDAQVTLVETDGEYNPDVWKNKTDIPFIIVVPDTETSILYITNP